MRRETAWDLRAFRSRLVVRGELVLRTALRVSAGRDTQIEAAADLPVLTDVAGRPYIPGSSLKGACRAATEALLRGAVDPAANAACVSVPRDETTAIPDVCLTQATVARLKQLAPGEAWEELKQRRPAYEPTQSLDANLRALSCWTCRVFGAPWLAGKVLVRDLALAPDWQELARAEVRDGVAIDRDTARAAHQRKYTYEAVPAGTHFDVEMVVENATEAELGLVWLGLEAMRRGLIRLGGGRSRGLGACALEIDWASTQWMTAESLPESLFPDEPGTIVGALGSGGELTVTRWREQFLTELQGGDHAAA